MCCIVSGRSCIKYVSDCTTVDQPAGTGYSYLAKGDPVNELDAAADKVIEFLQNFYRVFPEFAETQVRLFLQALSCA